MILSELTTILKPSGIYSKAGNIMRMQASNIKSLKSDNRALILDEIRKTPCSRAQLAETTHLTRSAITMIVQELIEEDILKETQALHSGRGRRQVLLDIVDDHKLALGLSLHRQEITVVLTDLRCRQIEKTSKLTRAFAGISDGETVVGDRADGADGVLEWAQDAMQGMITRHGLKRSDLVGVGISSPGPLRLSEGLILEPIDFPLFHNYPVVAKVQDWHFMFADDTEDLVNSDHDARAALNVSLDNNAVLLAMRELYQVAGQIARHRHILFVTISRGIGRCLINDGQIYRGAAGYAGELGHTSINSTGRPCSCGNFGCLERYATLQELKNFFGFDSYEVVVDLAYNGISKTIAIIEQIAEWLSAALVNAVNLFDLDAVVIYGELNYRPQLLMDMIRKRVNQRSLISRAHQVEVYASGYDDKTAAEASTAGIIDAWFKQKF
jgi:predicted NBD/HSP70 family sugar kinase